jgi:hypothetical protein
MLAYSATGENVRLGHGEDGIGEDHWRRTSAYPLRNADARQNKSQRQKAAGAAAWRLAASPDGS